MNSPQTALSYDYYQLYTNHRVKLCYLPFANCQLYIYILIKLPVGYQLSEITQ